MVDAAPDPLNRQYPIPRPPNGVDESLRRVVMEVARILEQHQYPHVTAVDIARLAPLIDQFIYGNDKETS